MRTLTGWTPRPLPRSPSVAGRHVEIRAFEPGSHAPALFDALGGAGAIDERLRWLGVPPLPDPATLQAGLELMAGQRGWVTNVFLPVAGGEPCGMASYTRADPENGVVEVGAVAHGAAMARGPMATEAHYLLARTIFDELGYRRYEWKLNDRNAASHATARRLGFRYEGVFRNDAVVPGPHGLESRDTAWYAMTDDDWPSIRAAFELWLEPANFDGDGRQRRQLWEIRGDLPAPGGPPRP